MINGHYVLVVAAGRGNRARRDDIAVPKQYASLAGKPILSHVLDKFATHSLINGIITVIHPDDEQEYHLASQKIGSKLLTFVHGGETRQQSVLNGLLALEAFKPEFVHIHDAARPCFSAALLSRLVADVETNGAVVPALAVSDTLKRGMDGLITETVDRTGLFAVQTPQSFKFETILAAHQAAIKAAQIAPKNHVTLNFTDDASIAEWHGIDVRLCEGEAKNIKITTLEDFATGAYYLSEGMDIRVGHGFDVHCFEAGEAVILCGISIPFEKKLKGHSDADVGLHALTDAIYGALADGDIGVHFPPSDPQWKGAASDVFLKHAASLVGSRGGLINNVDVTLICEAPKISPYSDEMRVRIAEILELDVSRVSVKATTTERLGFTGRGEGISAMATATIRL